MDRIQNIKNEVNQTQGGKLWVAPELEVLDAQKTYGGIIPDMNELETVMDFNGEES